MKNCAQSQNAHLSTILTAFWKKICYPEILLQPTQSHPKDSKPRVKGGGGKFVCFLSYSVNTQFSVPFISGQNSRHPITSHNLNHCYQIHHKLNSGSSLVFLCLCMCVCVCMHASVCACERESTCVCMHACTYVHVCACACVCSCSFFQSTFFFNYTKYIQL